MQVVLDARSLEMTSRGNITGQIWVVLDGESFPEDGWSDFPVVVLTWWIQALDRLSGNFEKIAELRFMDGPFSIRLGAHPAGDVEADFLSRSHSVRPSIKVELRALDMSIRSCAHLVLETCGLKDWHTDDVENLRRVLLHPSR